MILFKKAARGIWRGKRSYIACVALMAIGISVFTSFNILFVNLTAAERKMYEDQKFADAFAKVRGIPMDAATLISESVDGIEASDGRISADARVIIPGKEEKIITLRVSSFDPLEPEPMNAFLLTQGTAPASDEILIGDPFFKANNLEVGQPLTIIIEGSQITMTVSGAAQSPEYVYSIPDTGQLMPDNEAFGFAYMTYGRLAAITGRQGLADTLSFKLEDGRPFDAIKPELEDALAPYGLINAYPRKDHPSAAMLDQEINSIGGMATSLPMVFVLMAGIILYIMLGRVIEQERGSIGTLKAFGFSDIQILGHYICYGLIAGGAGGLLGCFGGSGISGAFTSIYLDYFNLPALKADIDLSYMAAGMLIALASGAAGAFMGTKKVLGLNPCEAMKPPAPRAVTHDSLAGLRFLKSVLAQSGYMAVRNITRNRFRSAFVVLGVAFSFSLIGVTSSYTDMMDKMMIEQFSKVQIYDVKVNLKEPKPLSDAEEAVYGITGVKDAEGVLEIPVEMRLANIRRNVQITALQSGSRLQKIYDSEGGFYLEPQKGGVIISDALAKKLDARRGDTLMIKTPYSGDDEIPVPLLGIVNETLGFNAYMELESLCVLLDTRKSANSVLISASDSASVKSELLTADNVSAVTDKNEARQIYDEMLESYGFMFVAMNLAGMGVAYAIIANTASVSLSERKREYATLRVLGMHPSEIGRILGFEYWLLTAVGIIPGIPLVRAIKTAMAGLMNSELFTIPLSTPLESYITAGVLCFVTVLICNFMSSRHIAKFDMVEVLKERE